jgi:hypothetical protein
VMVNAEQAPEGSQEVFLGVMTPSDLDDALAA